jgi:hypothetical protein
MPITDKSIKYSFLAEFHLIISDLDQILTFIEPSDENLQTFSHRIYELLLRTCTSYEGLSKRILYVDGSTKDLEKMSITDYFKLNSTYKLSQHEIIIDSWRSGLKSLSPFENWNQSTYRSLVWYVAYNNSKHDRHQNFKEANLYNLLNAICGLFILLFTQFRGDVFNKYQENTDYDQDDRGFIFYPNFIFAIKEPD